VNVDNYRMRLSIEIQPNGGQGYLRVEEQAELTLDGFLAVSQVLGRFHELVQTFKAEQAAAAAEYEAVMRGQ
jgi:hypothetical protein